MSTFTIDGTTYNGSQVSSVGPVREVKRSKPKPEGDTGELPPVYNFIFKVGYEAIKTPDFATENEAAVLRLAILEAMK